MQRGIILNIHFVYEYARKKRARWGGNNDYNRGNNRCFKRLTYGAMYAANNAFQGQLTPTTTH